MRPAPRVLLVGSLPLTAPWDGADKNLARALVDADRASRYTLLTGPTDRWGSHVTRVVVRRPKSVPGSHEWLRATWFAVAQVRGHDLLHVLATLRSANPVAAAALRTVGRVAGIPIVHTVPSIGDTAPARRHFVGDATIVFSRHTADRLVAAGVPGVVTMFPPLDPIAAPDDGAVASLRARHDLGSRAVLCATHADPGNGVDHLVAALARLPDDLSEVRLVVALRVRAGQSLEAEWARVRDAAMAAGVAARLRLVGSVADMPALIRACAVTALVPRTLSGKMDLPLILLESLALERPVVVTDLPPLNEAVLGGGLTVGVGDVPALTDALVRLLRQPEQAAALALTGAARLRTEARPERVAATMAQVYASVLDGAASGRRRSA
jgi:glycosyltransferase involved in cell wall biosynthesis